MLPLLVVGGVIGAVMSIAKGASWLSDQVDSATSSAAAGGKAAAPAVADTKTSAFETTLAAQAAGQPLPVNAGNAASAIPASSTTPVSSSTMVPELHGSDYEQLARVRAGLFAYSHVGEHHDQNQVGQNQVGGKDTNPVTGS
jgi:hypothetical protein